MLDRLLDRRYRVLKLLSSGGFSQTYLAEDTRRPSQPTCVVKHFKPASDDPEFLQEARARFHREAETLETLGTHDQIPRLLAFFEEDQEFFLVQEFVDGTALSDELLGGTRYDEAAALALLEDVLRVLVFIHDQQVIHRDIKPSNLIRRQSDGKIVLIDFGAVKAVPAQLAPSTPTIQIGTPGYIPLEQAAGHPHFSSDLYALGMTVIQALTGKTPEQLLNPEGQRIWQDQAAIGRGLVNVLERMICDPYAHRYASAQECWEALQELTAGSEISLTRLATNRLPLHPNSSKNPELPSLRLLVGTGLVLLCTTSGVAFAYLQTRSNQASLAQLQQLQAQKNYPGCRDRAQVLDQALWIDVNLHNQVGEILKQCQTALDLQTLAQARQLAGQGQLVAAIAQASRLPGNSSLYPDAQELSRTWANRILDLGWSQYHAGELDKAIAYAQAVPARAINFQQAQTTIEQWRTDWQRAETQFTRAQLAFDQDQWQAVLQVVQENQLPSSRFWQAKLKALGQQATQSQQAQADRRDKRVVETLSRLKQDQDQLGQAILDIAYPNKVYKQTQAVSELQSRRDGDRVIFEISIATDGWLWTSKTITVDWEVEMLAQRHRGAEVVNNHIDDDRAKALDNYFSGLVPKYL